MAVGECWDAEAGVYYEGSQEPRDMGCLCG